MTDDRYHMPICIGIGIRISIGISIGKISALYLISKVSEKSGISPPLLHLLARKFKFHFA